MGRKTFYAVATALGLVGIAVLVDLALTGRPTPAPVPPAPKPPVAKQTVYLDQGWSPQLREAFYFTTQGSQLLPYAFLVALEQPDGDKPFLAADYISETGFLPAEKSAQNPDGLPIGFVKDDRAGGPLGPAVGMTCAACHTGEVVSGNVAIRIDGGAALGDYQLLMARLTKALDATLADPAKFQRFAARIGGDPRAVRAGLESTALSIRRLEATAWTPVAYGRGRLDAFGHILNAVAGDAMGIPENLRTPDAPVSYPFLWTTPAQRFVQWNGVAGNPIGRNLGEVLGVFGRTNLSGGKPDTFSSAARVKELHLLEEWAADLKPPPWPQEHLGQVDRAKAAEGELLFKAHCAGCHGGPDYRLTDPAEAEGGRRFLAVSMVPLEVVKTDPKMLQNFATRTALTGRYAEAFGGAPQVPAGKVLLAVVGNVVENDLKALDLTPEQRKAYYGGRFAPDGTSILQGFAPPPLAYKAGPLAGVWATGPFLHNGSVPTIYDLLSPEAERPARFHVGSTRYDPKKLGFISDAGEVPEAERSRLFLYDTSLPGNSNRGHAFPEGAPLTPEQRLAVIEYLKILEGPDGRTR